MEIIEKIKRDIDKGNFRLALKKLKNNKKTINKSQYHFFYAEISRMQGFLIPAIREYQISLNYKMEPVLKIEILNKLSACFRTIGNKKLALKTAKAALKLSVKNKINIEDSMLENAMSLRLAGEYSKAIKTFNKLIKIYSSKKDWAGISYIYWALGGIYRLKGNFKAGIYYFKKSFTIANKIQDRDLQAYALLGLGGILRISGAVHQSFLTYKKAKKFINKNDTFGQAYSLCGIANSLRQQGKLKKAKKLYFKAVKLYKLTGDKPDLGFVYWGIGEISKKEGNLLEALKYFKKAQTFFKKGYEKRGEILNLISLAQTIYLMGKIKEAKILINTAYKISKSEKLNTYLEIFA